MRMNARREDKVMIERKEVEDVEEFVYLGATVTKECGGTEDIKKTSKQGTGSFLQPKEDLEYKEHWSEYKNQTV